MNNFMCQALKQDGEEHGPGMMKPQALLKHTFLTFTISLGERQRDPRFVWRSRGVKRLRVGGEGPVCVEGLMCTPHKLSASHTSTTP